MRIALAIFRLVPRGGAEDHCIRLAGELARRGHEVTLLTTVPDEFVALPVTRIALPARQRTNHTRMAGFAKEISRIAASGRFDRLLSFQPVPGIPLLYCADQLRNRRDVSWLKRLTPRFRVYARLERGCFAPDAPTRILFPARRQAEEYRQRYGTPAERLLIFPPAIDRTLRQPERRAAEQRAELRRRLHLTDADHAWLWLGLQPQIKGLDRVITALAANPRAVLLAGGLQAEDAKVRPLRAMAAANGTTDRIRWLGYLRREEKLDAFAAADLLVHPARREVAGAVILEALINGLPVVTTANCGFAEHVEKSGAGIVIGEECTPDELAHAIARAAGTENAGMSAAGIRYGEQAPLYDGIAVAADKVEAA